MKKLELMNRGNLDTINLIQTVNELQDQINAIKEELDVVYDTLERLSDKKDESIEQPRAEIKDEMKWDFDNEYARGYNDGAHEARVQNIVVYATANDGEGKVTKIGTYESIEDIVIHTGMFNNVEITFEYDNRKD